MRLWWTCVAEFDLQTDDLGTVASFLPPGYDLALEMTQGDFAKIAQITLSHEISKAPDRQVV